LNDLLGDAPQQAVLSTTVESEVRLRPRDHDIAADTEVVGPRHIVELEVDVMGVGVVPLALDA
jgi:hypothetical protein